MAGLLFTLLDSSSAYNDFYKEAEKCRIGSEATISEQNMKLGKLEQVLSNSEAANKNLNEENQNLKREISDLKDEVSRSPSAPFCPFVKKLFIYIILSPYPLSKGQVLEVGSTRS